MTKVSIVIPVYNSEKYLSVCLDSLLCQTLKEFEIICVDDGSTDQSLKILKEYEAKDNRIRIIHQNNLYAGVARNNGLALVTGEYVCFFDSDDFYNRSLLEKAYKKAKITDADIVIFGAKKYDTETKTYEKTNLYFDKKFLPRKEVFSRHDIPNEILMITSPALWTKMYKTEFIRNNNLQFQPLQNTNDAYFSLVSLCIAERISYVNEDLTYYRVGQKNNLQSQKRKFPTCFVDAYTAVYNELKRKGIFDEVEKSYVNMVMSGCSYNIDTTMDPYAKLQICEGLSNPQFLDSGFMSHPQSYYLDIHQYEKIAECIRKWKPYQKILEQCRTWSKKLSLSLNSPNVSVIIPVYNTEKYIEECLTSICNQSLQTIEIIIVDDGTTDHAIEKVQHFIKNDPRIHVIHKANGGLSSARNTGLCQATGEYILFVDSDDKLCKYALEILYYYAKHNLLDDLFFGAEAFLDSDSNQERLKDEWNKYRHYYERKGKYTNSTKGQTLFTEFVNNNDFKPSACLQLLRREFLQNNKLRFREGIIHEDNLFTMQCLLFAEHASFLNLNLYFRRIHQNSIMTTKQGFSNTYGYYISAMEMIHTIKLYDREIDESYIVAIGRQMQQLLIAAQNSLSQIPLGEQYEEKRKLKVCDRLLFDLLISDKQSPADKISKIQRFLLKIYKVIARNSK